MATTGPESPEQEKKRMQAIAAMKAELDALIEDTKKKEAEAEASQFGMKIPAAIRKAAEDKIKKMEKELKELHFRVNIVPQKTSDTYKCHNTGLSEFCPEKKPTQYNTTCDLCNNKFGRI